MAWFDKLVSSRPPTRRTGAIVELPPILGGESFTDAFKIGLKVNESNETLLEDSTFSIELFQNDLVLIPTETTKLGIQGFAENNGIPNDNRNFGVRVWFTGATATGSSASASTAIAPANANDQNNGVFAHLKTGQGTPPDTLNPAIIDTADFIVPTHFLSNPFNNANIKVWFKMAGITAALLDNFFIRADWAAGGTRIVWQGPALATVLWPGVDFSIIPIEVDVTDLTIAQLSTLQLRASYNAGVVLTAQSSLEIDAWCIELETML